MPYALLKNNKIINKGHLLSTRDLCGLEYIPQLIKAGVHCLKIEGRMKSPEYVATVTRIYRKYIDLAMSNKHFEISTQDKKDLMQVFNRGAFSDGHLNIKPNKHLVYKDKPGNLGLFLGNVKHINKNKGYLTLKLQEQINIGDTILLEKEQNTYTISELMENGKNIITAKIGQIVTIGRMKGNINLGDSVYKMSSKYLNTLAKQSYQKENRKIKLNCEITIQKNSPISIYITSADVCSCYKYLDVIVSLDYLPEEAKNKPLTKEIVISQISKTSSTPYIFDKIKVNLDNNTFLPKLSILNELRRLGLDKVKEYALTKIHRTYKHKLRLPIVSKNISHKQNPNISILFNELNTNLDYSSLEKPNHIYIPLKYFTNATYESILNFLTSHYKTYIYMPTIINQNYITLFSNYIIKSIKNYNIFGFIVSNISNFKLLRDILKKDFSKYEIIANYTLNVYNLYTVEALKNLGANLYTISPELDAQNISYLGNTTFLPSSLIVYGKIPLMNMRYCLLGESNKSYSTCNRYV